MKKRKNYRVNDKTGFRANGPILPLALRPGLGFWTKVARARALGGGLLSGRALGGGLLVASFSRRFVGTVAVVLVALCGVFVGIGAGQEVFASSVTLTVPSEALSLEITPNSGTVFQKSSAGTIRVATDSSYGYTLSIYAKNGDSESGKSNDLLNGESKISSIVSALNEEEFQSSGESNIWGYMPSKLDSSVNSNFQPGPTADPTTLDVVDSSSEGTDYDITLATKIDNTLPSGTYHNTFVLTAVSNDPAYDGIMQNWSGCDDLPEETKTLNLLDTRDNKTYTVAKLKDGKCWMTKNLEIENYKLTAADSDVTGDFELPASTDRPNSGDSYTSTDLHVDSTYGGYYTWYTATAGEGTQSVSTNGQNVEHSICPKGWKLPTRDDFIALDRAFGGTGANGQSSSYNVGGGKTLLQMYTEEPAHFLMGGGYLSGSAYSVGTGAGYWSSTAYTSNYAYYLDFSSSGVYPQMSNVTKYYLRSVRCVSRSSDPTMQNVEKWADSVEADQTFSATDTRDGKEYTVSRLADNKLWMTENLRIQNYNMTEADSDVGSEGFTLPASVASASQFNPSNQFNTSFVYVDNTYGGYYTWYAATAGEGTKSKSSGDVSHSICPKGWRLPTQPEFSALVNALGGTSSAGATALQSDPANFLRGGGYNGGSSVFVGSSGFYWSASARPSNSNDAYILNFDSSSINPAYGNLKNYGFSVRCVSRIDDPKEVGTMQTVDEWGDSVKKGKTAISKDTRDNKTYTVARLADGKLWMTENLRIQNYKMTEADSDVGSGGFTLPASVTSVSQFNPSNQYDTSFVYVDNTYGGYYTWFAATAGDGTRYGLTSGDAQHSICPRGWRLPTQPEFQALATALGGTSSAGAQALMSEPANFLWGGYFGGSSYNVGSYGFYWSASAHPSVNRSAYSLYFDSSSVNLANGYYKNYGLSVRCVSRQ